MFYTSIDTQTEGSGRRRSRENGEARRNFRETSSPLSPLGEPWTRALLDPLEVNYSVRRRCLSGLSSCFSFSMMSSQRSTRLLDDTPSSVFRKDFFLERILLFCTRNTEGDMECVYTPKREMRNVLSAIQGVLSPLYFSSLSLLDS